jgi:hypothetical protein
MVVGTLAADADLDGIARAPAEQSTAGKIRGAGLDAIVHCRMYRDFRHSKSSQS